MNKTEKDTNVEDVTRNMRENVELYDRNDNENSTVIDISYVILN
jgi:hypothetical protein